MKGAVKTYSIDPNAPSGLELELLSMPQFFAEHPNALEAHAHAFYKIIWFQHASGVHSVDFVDYPVSDNTIFFIAPGQVHQFDGSTTNCGVAIHFNASFMSDEASSESIFLKYDLFGAYDSMPYYKVSPSEAQHLMTLVDEMKSEFALSNAFAHREYMQYLVRMFLIRVQRNGERSPKTKLNVCSVANRTFVRFRQLLEQNFRSVHTVGAYADMLHISSRTLSKYVDESAHISPLQLINDRIALEAKRQLQHSTLSIKEIGYNLGFEDPPYFVKFFKRMTGTIPNEFRTQAHRAFISNTNNKMNMKIAIPTANGRLFPHFGKAPQVTLFDVQDNAIESKQVVDAPAHAHGALPRFLQQLGVSDVICGGLGAGAVNLLSEMNIAIHGGAPAEDVDKIMADFLAGSLVYGDATCHHDGCGGHDHDHDHNHDHEGCHHNH